MEAQASGRRVAIVAHKPKPGCEKHLLELTLEHVPLLREYGYATDFPATILRASDGALLEIFEWEDGGIANAESDPRAAKLWFRYAEISSTVPLNTLAEAAMMFAAFTSLGVV